MEGVQILSQVDIMESSDLLGNLWLCFLAIVVFTIGVGAILDKDKLFKFGLVLGVMWVLSGFIVATYEIPTGEYEYKVTINDGVNFNEFNARYEVVGQDGLIYTVREREKNE